MICKKCGTELKDYEAICYKCGMPVSGHEGARKIKRKLPSWPFLIAGGVLLLLAIVILFAFILRGSEDNNEEQPVPTEEAAPTKPATEGSGKKPTPTKAPEEEEVDPAEAYAEILNREDIRDPKYDLAYINDDDIPELIEMAYEMDGQGAAQFELYNMYTIRDGKAEKIDHGHTYMGYFERADFVQAGQEDQSLQAFFKSVFEEGTSLLWTECDWDAMARGASDEECYPEGGVIYLTDGSGKRRISRAEYDAELEKHGTQIRKRELSKAGVEGILSGLKDGGDIWPEGKEEMKPTPTPIPTPTPTPEPEAENEEPVLYTVIVTAEDDHVNFREGPGTDYPIIEPIPNGTQLSILEDRDTWLRINYNGHSGWVATTQITKLE